MPVEYLDHEADVGLRATGRNPKEAFEEGAVGLMGIMYDPSLVQATKRVHLTAEAETLELLFVEFLNEIISLIGRKGMFFMRCRIDGLATSEKKCVVKATLEGEASDVRRHHVHTEVKAATYSGLKSKVTDAEAMFQCVLDV